MSAPLTPSPLQLAHYRSQLKRFAVFTDAEWQLFTERLYLRRLAKRELIATAGKVCTEVCFVYNGSARLFFTKDGVEISSYFSFQNDLVSSYRSFLKGTPSLVSIEAMEDTELLCFSHAALQELLQHPVTAYRMECFGRAVAEWLICCYEERTASFITQSAGERYASLLNEQPQFLERIPQRHLANYLGITPVSLSRIRRRMFTQKARRMAS